MTSFEWYQLRGAIKQMLIQTHVIPQAGLTRYEQCLAQKNLSRALYRELITCDVNNEKKLSKWSQEFGHTYENEDFLE